MSSAPVAGGEGREPNTLPNRPETKLPRIPKGSRIHKRPLPGLSPTSRTTSRVLASGARVAVGAPGPDGYLPRARAAHTTVIRVSASAKFMSLVTRVRKALENGPQKTQGLALAARIAALEVRKGGVAAAAGAAAAAAAAGGGTGAGGGVVEDALDDVVLVATGRAIQKAVEVGGFFTRQMDLVVLARTRTLRAVDDIVVEDDDDADVEDQVRVRNLSCVEVGIRWAS